MPPQPVPPLSKNQRKKLAKQRNKLTRISKRIYNCSQCRKSYSTINALDTHQVRRHNLKQDSLKNQRQSGISTSSFGGYSMPQGSNAFSGMPADPSRPSTSVMYGTSQTLAAAPASGIYQAFSHVDAPVIGSSGRQYQQYPTQAASSGHYGLYLSAHPPMDYQSMSSYQHQQPGEAPSHSSRISPGPISTDGGGETSAGVIISSTSSLMNMKQTGNGSHPSIPHQVALQGYSQLSHHHLAAAFLHPQHHLGAVGPAKGGYSQSGMATPSQAPIPFNLNQSPSIFNLGQNFISSTMRSGPSGTTTTRDLDFITNAVLEDIDEPKSLKYIACHSGMFLNGMVCGGGQGASNTTTTTTSNDATVLGGYEGMLKALSKMTR